MLNAPLLLSFYITACAIVVIVLFVLFLRMARSKIAVQNYIANSILLGIWCITFYCFFLLSKTVFYAVLFDGLYFAGTTWLAFSMLYFAVHYTGITVQYRKLYRLVGIILCSFDTISLLLNNHFHHMFRLMHQVDYTGNLAIGFLANNFYWLHYVHLSLCYLFVATTFVLFSIALIKSPSFYKKKYSGIVIAYFFVIIANFLSYSLNFPIDFSVVMYGVLAGFICFFSAYSYPKQMVSNALRVVHRNISDAIIYYDIDGNCLYANHSAKNLFREDSVFSYEKAEEYRKRIENPMMLSLEGEGSDLSEKEIFYTKDSIKLGDKEFIFDVEYQHVYTYEGNQKRKNGSILKLVDIGDIVGFYGSIRRTPRGELSIKSTDLKLLSKSLNTVAASKVVLYLSTS